MPCYPSLLGRAAWRVVVVSLRLLAGVGLVSAQEVGDDPSVEAAAVDVAQARERIATLRAEIARHDDLYYRQAAPEISDAAYDALARELGDWEAAFPQVAAALGERERMGDDRTGRFPEAAHAAPMLSLEKAYALSELEGAYARWEAANGGRPVAVRVEPKFDGMAISLVYEGGRLMRAVTRGNGRVGEVVTANLLATRAAPERLAGPMEQAPRLLEARGEVVASWEVFEAVNRERESVGKAPFAHPRNYAAGSLKLEDSAEVEERSLDVVIFGYGAYAAEFGEPANLEAFVSQAEGWGLPVAEPLARTLGKAALKAAVEAAAGQRHAYPYPLDGLVLKVEDRALREALGKSEVGPRWAVAYKFPARRGESRLRRIDWQVGRTGRLTPVAVFNPVTLDGATLERASLHNAAWVEERGARLGARIWVERIGGVIPQVVAVESLAENGDAAALPRACPACGGAVGREGSELRCLAPACSGRRLRELAHFVSPSAVDISGLGPSTLARWMERGWVNEVADLYSLGTRLRRAEGGELSASEQALLAEIEASKEAALWRVIYGLGIPEVGPARAKALASAYGGLGALAEAGEADFRAGGRWELAGLGPSARAAGAAYFAEQGHREGLRRLASAGLGAAGGAESDRLAGAVIVFTGRLERWTRAEAEALVEAAGGVVGLRVSEETDWLVAGERPGAKRERARALGVAELSEAAFAELLGIAVE